MLTMISLIGDLTNLVGCILTHQLPFQVSLFSVSVNCVSPNSSLSRHYLPHISPSSILLCFLSTFIIAKLPLRRCQLSPTRARVLVPSLIAHQERGHRLTTALSLQL